MLVKVLCPGSIYQDPSTEHFVWREHGGDLSAHEGAAVEAAHQGTNQEWLPSWTKHSCNSEIALAEGNSFTWAVKFLVSHWCMLKHQD